MKVSVRKFDPKDRSQVISLWQTVFPDDPHHNEPGRMIDAKLAADRTLDVREITAFTEIAHEVRQALRVGHSYDED